MNSFARFTPFLALLLPLAACLTDDHTVGTDSGDADDCAGQAAPPCAAPEPGCSWEGPTCVDGHLGCGTMVCGDAGSGSGSAEGTDAGASDGDDCEGQAPPPCPAPEPGCTWEGPLCVDGHLGCGTEVCSDAGTSTFACGGADLSCDSATQYCSIVEGGPIEPDGGTSGHISCETIPSNCEDPASAADTCACIKSQTETSGTCSVSGSSITITLEAP